MCSQTELKLKVSEVPKVPSLLKPWIFLYKKVPNIININGVGFTFAVLSFLYLAVWRISSLYLLYSLGWPSWPDNYLTQKAVGSAVAIVHAIQLEFPLFACLLAQPFIPSKRMDASPLWLQHATNALLEFCTGYMIHDTIFIMIRAYETGESLNNSDLSFIGHHIACSIYMNSARLVGAGHLSAMMLMFTGEFTCPFQNAHAMLGFALDTACCNGTITQLLHKYIELVSCILYCFFRTFVGPICALYIMYDLIFTKNGRKNVPVALSVFWCIPMWGVLIGSIPWIKECYGLILDFTNGQQQEL